MKRRRLLWFVLGGLSVSLLLAGVASGFASSQPDGLEHVTRDGCQYDDEGNVTGGECIAKEERGHELADRNPLADYGIRDLTNGRLSTGLAGVTGVAITFALAGGLFWLLRRRRPAVPDRE